MLPDAPADDSTASAAANERTAAAGRPVRGTGLRVTRWRGTGLLKTGLLVTGLLVTGLLVTGCGPSGAPEAEHAADDDGATAERELAAETDSDRWMRRVLHSYQEGVSDDPFLGQAKLQRSREMLRILEHADGPERLLPLHEEIIQGELRLGNLDAAIAHVERAEILMETLGRKLSRDRRAELLVAHGIAYLRLAETENCVHCRTGESCLLPIQGSGVHEQTAGASAAAERFTAALALQPKDWVAGWLLNIAHMALGTYPDGVPAAFRLPPERFADGADFPRFPNVAHQRGLDTMSLSGGAIADDFDRDGTIDLLVSDWDASGQLRIFWNDGRGGFREGTEAARLEGLYGGLNMVQADYDNDGWLDVFILRGAWKAAQGRQANSLLHNEGDGTFRDVTREVGLAEIHYPTQTAAWADYDRDGDLDLYIGNEDYPSQLFRNDEGRRFRDVANVAGVENGRYAKAVTWGDYDADGDPDLYVSNYGAANRLYRNEGGGTFTDVAADVGVEGPSKSFPAWFWDVNNDGALDLFVASYPMEMQQVAAQAYGQPVTAEADRLYLGDGQGGFIERGEAMGLTQVTDPMGSNFGDLDNDGFLDFYLGTGAPPFEFLVPNWMYRNRGGEAFENVTYSGGFGHLQKGHAVAFADFDRDGDLDVFQEMGGAYPGDAFGNALFQNPGFGHHWLAVSLVGVGSPKTPIGARIKLNLGGQAAGTSLYRWVNSGGSFGGNPLRQHFGLADAQQIESLEITWPTSGKTQTIRDLPIDQAIEIVEGQDDVRRLAPE